MAKKDAEKSAKALSEALLNPRKNGFFAVSDEKIEKADKFCEGYKAFLDSAKTERESVEYAVKAAEKHGFVPFDPAHEYAPGDKGTTTTAARRCASRSSARRAAKTACASPRPTSTIRAST